MAFSTDGKTIAMSGTGRPWMRGVLQNRMGATDRIWMANADPLHYGTNFQTDAKGAITFRALIAGATYRIVNHDGKSKDFKVEAGKTVNLKDIVVKEPPRPLGVGIVPPKKVKILDKPR
jgi:hypothetical protein